MKVESYFCDSRIYKPIKRPFWKIQKKGLPPKVSHDESWNCWRYFLEHIIPLAQEAGAIICRGGLFNARRKLGITIPNFYLQNLNKKENIVAAALELITINGVHATPMSAIAKAAGTGMGTIYNYYATKELLINDIYTSIKEKEELLFERFLMDHDIKTQFTNYYKTSVMFFTENPSYFRFMEQLHASPIITDESKQVGQKAIDCVLQLITSGKQQKRIKDIPADELMQFIGGSVFSYVGWYLSGKKDSNETALTNQIQMVWDAIQE